MKMPMTGSIIYAAAKTYDAIVWTQDSDFEDLESVRYFNFRFLVILSNINLTYLL